ncbi:hypothetical protein Gotur_008323 [Gossypium turneri]
MSDQSEELPFMAPPPITEPSEINLEAGPANQIQCRICLKTDGVLFFTAVISLLELNFNASVAVLVSGCQLF